MANPFVKAWKYVMALFNSKIDENADPKIQIQQAIEEAQRQHQALTQQAAQVIGNQRQLEMRLNRQLADIEKLQANVRQALTLADQATAAGDAAKATEYNNAAEAFAAQLVTAEQSVEDLKGLHDQALQRRGAGQEGRRAERDGAAAEDRRAHQAAQPARAGQDAGAGQRVAAVDERDRRAGQAPRASKRFATRSSVATPTRWAQAELAQNSVQGRMIEVQQAGVRWPVIPGSSRSGRPCAARRCPPVGRRRRQTAAPAPRPRRRKPAHREAHRSVGTNEHMAVQSGRSGLDGHCCSAASTPPAIFSTWSPKSSAPPPIRGPTATAATSPRTALGAALLRRHRVLGCGDGDPGGVGLVRTAARDHRGSRSRRRRCSRRCC